MKTDPPEPRRQAGLFSYPSYLRPTPIGSVPRATGRAPGRPDVPAELLLYLVQGHELDHRGLMPDHVFETAARDAKITDPEEIRAIWDRDFADRVRALNGWRPDTDAMRQAVRQAGDTIEAWVRMRHCYPRTPSYPVWTNLVVPSYPEADRLLKRERGAISCAACDRARDRNGSIRSRHRRGCE